MADTLGRIKRHDEKSREYAYPLRRAIKGQSVRHQLLTKNLDQFYLGACVGFSGANLLNTQPARASRAAFNRVVHQRFQNRYLGQDDGIRSYSESTIRDPWPGEYPPTDEGSSAIGLMSWWKDAGIISRYEWTFTFEGFLAALQRQPVLIGSWWYEGLGEPDSKGVVRLSGQQLGGHEYLANAILWDRKLIGCEQSWGEEYGAWGKFYVSFEDMEHLIMDEGDVAVPILL